MRRIIRVFPRKTTATPDDELAVINRPPTSSDQADEIRISVTFDADIEKATHLYELWKHVAPTTIGGAAFGDAGGEFTPGLYLKHGYVITSRGCPNNCWFCRAWKIEGRRIRELRIHDGYNILDNNLLACSYHHQQAVFKMLDRQKQHPIFSGGLEAKRLESWHLGWMLRLKPKMMWFAYDEPKDWEPLVQAGNLLREAHLFNSSHIAGCYVLCGWARDTIEDAERRCNEALRLGYFVQAMLYDRGRLFEEAKMKQWRRWQRTWANKYIVGSRMSKMEKENSCQSARLP